MFHGIDQAKAREFLTNLLADLLGGSHAYLLPCEAVFDYLSKNRSIESSVEEMKENENKSCSSRYGPVPNFEEYDPPGAAEAKQDHRAPVRVIPRVGRDGHMTAHFPRPAILDRISLERHAVIEASAGTGKTYTIEHMVVDLILRGRVPITEILVLTFTERAAAELRQRIRSKIEEILPRRGRRCTAWRQAAGGRLADRRGCPPESEPRPVFV